MSVTGLRCKGRERRSVTKGAQRPARGLPEVSEIVVERENPRYVMESAGRSVRELITVALNVSHLMDSDSIES